MSNAQLNALVEAHMQARGITRCPPRTARGGGSKQRSLASLAFQLQQLDTARAGTQSTLQASKSVTR